jgi:endonuclease/exonuclease/phosphatase family metal-dependent hydrolase
MRLITWNISAFNKDIEKALSSILSYDPDILCIQELPQSGVDYLKQLSNYEMVYSLDTEVDISSKNAFLVILTKYKIIGTGTHEYGKDRISSPFVWCSEKLFGRKRENKSLYIDIDTVSGIKRVHTLHLTWPVGPKTRIQQFLNFLDSAKPDKTHLILGDLNVFGKIGNNILAYIPFGYALNELFMYEKSIFQDLFEKYGWQNPFDGTISSTWPWNLSGAQLDYILIPKDATVKHKYLFKETYGSDHRPQLLEIL